MIGHGSPTEEALHARTRCDRAFFIRDRSESFSSIIASAPQSLAFPDRPFLRQDLAIH